MRALTIGLGLLVCLLSRGLAADWLHYRGPSGDGSVAEGVRVPSGPARVAWKTQVGVGCASVVVRGEKVYTAGQDGTVEQVQCLDALRGTLLWVFRYPCALADHLFEGGSRATPTLAGDAVYALSHEGDLHCLDAASGKLRWKRHLVRDFAARRPEWGFSGAPLVSDGRVYVDCGAASGSTLALDASDGALIWKSGADVCGYASPLLMNLAGRRFLVLFKGGALVGLAPEDGREAWRFPWKTNYDINAATPLQVGADRVLITSGYGTGAALVEISPSGARQVWRSRNLRAHVNSPAVWGGGIFGVDGNTGGGNLVCLDVQTGGVGGGGSVSGGRRA